MIKVQKALDLINENPKYEPNSADLEMVTIVNSIRDPEFKKSMALNQKKDQFYDYKSESKYVAEYNDEPSWFFVFCKKNIRNIDLLIKVHKNHELAKQILDELIPNYSRKEYLEELFNNAIIEQTMKANYQLSMKNKNILDNFELIEDDLLVAKNLTFEKDYNFAFYKLNNENFISSKEFSGIKKSFTLKLIDLYTSFHGLESFDHKLDYDKFYSWVESSITNLFYTPVVYEYDLGSKYINFKMIKELTAEIKSQVSFALSKKNEKKDKIKKITFDAIWLLFKQVSGMSTIESLKELVDQIDELKEVSKIMIDSSELSAIHHKEKVSILYDEFKKSNHNTFKVFFITFFQQAITNLFKEWGVEIPKQNVENAYVYFMDKIVKVNIVIDPVILAQSKSYKDKDLFYIECMLNQRFMNKEEELFNNLY